MIGDVLAEMGDTPRLLAELVTQAGASAIDHAERGEWGLRAIAAHLLDDESFDFRLRLERILSEDAPRLDGYPWGSGQDRLGDPIADLVREFALQRQASLNLLEGFVANDIPPEAVLEGGRTLRVDGLAREWLDHDREHLAQAAGIRERIERGPNAASDTDKHTGEEYA